MEFCTLNMKTLLWLDDTRDPYAGTWTEDYSPLIYPYTLVWVKSYKEFISYVKENGLPDAICFDHDLGDVVEQLARSNGKSKKDARTLKQKEKTGHDCAKWLVDYCLDNKQKLPLWNVQSANPVGKENINMLLLAFKKHQDNE